MDRHALARRECAQARSGCRKCREKASRRGPHRVSGPSRLALIAYSLGSAVAARAGAQKQILPGIEPTGGQVFSH